MFHHVSGFNPMEIPMFHASLGALAPLWGQGRRNERGAAERAASSHRWGVVFFDEPWICNITYIDI